MSPLEQSQPLSRRRFLGLSAGAAAVIGTGLTKTGTGQRFAPSTNLIRPRSGKATLNVPIPSAPFTPALLQVIDSYQRATGNTVKTSAYPLAALYTQEIDNFFHGGNAFDVVVVNSNWSGQYYHNGWLVPILDVDSNFRWPRGLIEYGGVCRWDHVHKVTSLTGTPMTLPLVGNIQLLYYRSDLYKKLGLKLPETWSEVYDNAQRAQKAGLARYGVGVQGQPSIGGYANTYAFGAVLASYGGTWFVDSAKGNYEPAINDERGRAAMTEWVRLSKLGPPQPQTLGQPELASLMQSGELLQVPLNDASHALMDKPSQSTVVDKVDYAVMPAGSGSGARRATLAGIWNLGIPTGISKSRQRAALDFMSWMTKDSTQVAFTKAGGIPTSQAVYNSGLAKQTPYRFMRAVAKSMPYVENDITYPFEPQMAAVTEPLIGEILAGTVSVRKGLDEIARGFNKIQKTKL